MKNENILNMFSSVPAAFKTMQNKAVYVTVYSC